MAEVSTKANDVIDIEDQTSDNEKENLDASTSRPARKRSSILSYFNREDETDGKDEKDKDHVPEDEEEDSDDSDLPYTPVTKKSKTTATRGRGRGRGTTPASAGRGTPKGRATPKVGRSGSRKNGDFSTKTSQNKFYKQ